MLDKKQIEGLKLVLKHVYNAQGAERVGFIQDSRIIEVPNYSVNSEEGFLVGVADNIKYTDDPATQATWHTHPGALSNLSGDDFETFRMWPDYHHFIIGSDGVRCYFYDQVRNAVMEVR